MMQVPALQERFYLLCFVSTSVMVWWYLSLLSTSTTTTVNTTTTSITNHRAVFTRSIVSTVLDLKPASSIAMRDRYSERNKYSNVTKENNYFRVIDPGETIRAGSLQVHIVTASFYSHTDLDNNFQLFLNGWGKHNTSFEVYCCLYESLKPSANHRVLRVGSRVHHEYVQWVVDMQNLELTCPMEKGEQFRYVSFTDTSCLIPGDGDDVMHNLTSTSEPIDVMLILFPQRLKNSVGVCLKVSYGSLDPIRVLEWFEYARLMGVTKVFTYFWDVDPAAMRVFKYYQHIGFLDLLPIFPAMADGGMPRGYRKPRYERQAWVDEVMSANDCKHRMAGFDYVIVMDLDEYIFPKPVEGKLNTGYLSILQEANAIVPEAGGFSFDSHVVMLDWNKTRSSPLLICSYVNRTNVANPYGADRQTRWAFRPRRMTYVQNNRVWPTPEYSWINVPTELYTLFHFRECEHRFWKGCLSEDIRERDESMTRYEEALVKRILEQPVDQILQDNREYVRNLREWRRAQLQKKILLNNISESQLTKPRYLKKKTIRVNDTRTLSDANN